MLAGSEADILKAKGSQVEIVREMCAQQRFCEKNVQKYNFSNKVLKIRGLWRKVLRSRDFENKILTSRKIKTPGTKFFTSRESVLKKMFSNSNSEGKWHFCCSVFRKENSMCFHHGVHRHSTAVTTFALLSRLPLSPLEKCCSCRCFKHILPL